MGIHITNGPWGENFSWDALTCLRDAKYSGYGDLSAPMTQAFRHYLRMKYGCVAALRRAWRDETVDFGTARVPDKAAREELNAEGWRDPACGRRVPDYFECQNKVTVDMLEHYAALVKDASRGNLLTLAFYGYTQDEPWPIECDHRAISRALRSKVLDCFSAPHTYRRPRLPVIPAGGAQERRVSACGKPLRPVAVSSCCVLSHDMNTPVTPQGIQVVTTQNPCLFVGQSKVDC